MVCQPVSLEKQLPVLRALDATSLLFECRRGQDRPLSQFSI